MTNKEKMASALQAIRDLGYTIVYDKTGSTYFVFEGADDSICHFKIKEIPRIFICILGDR